MTDQLRRRLESLIAQRKRCGADACRTRNCARCKRGAQLTLNRVITANGEQ